MTAALFLFGLLNAALYSSVLPLWEGFDEPYHYAYVQYLATQGRFPVIDHSTISDEIWDSILLAPASHVVRQNTPQVTTFDDYARLDPAERRRRRGQLDSLDPALRFSYTRGAGSYEAQQAPLAYLALAGWDRLWAGLPLAARVWRLRLVCALVSAAAMGWATLWLAARIGLAPPWRNAALFLLFATQMLYGAIAHIANDWLSVALLPVLLIAAIRFQDSPGAGRAAWLGAALAAGLLAKAYFLIFVPFAAVLALRGGRRGAAAFLAALSIAAPWYVRNLLLYGSLTGLQTVVARVSSATLAESIRTLPWLEALPATARGVLWTGNGSFLTFSPVTLNAMLLLVAAGWACWILRRGRKPAEWLAAATLVLHSTILVYTIALLYVLNRAAVSGPAPWYAPALYPAAFCLCLAGLMRAGRFGRVALAAMLALWAYVIAATWIVKLIPWYAGFGARATPARLWMVYGDSRLMDNLGSVALVGPGVGLMLAAVTALFAVVLCGRLIYDAR